MLPVYFKSTRTNAAHHSFSEAVVKGISPDGGLFVPSKFPQFDLYEHGLTKLSYQALAVKILSLYLNDFTNDEIKACVYSAYDSKFADQSIAPLHSCDNAHFIELYHGKTLAFKDMALSILPYLLKTACKKLSIDKKIVILTATSGDTGKAALEGFADVEGIEIIVFYPTDGVSDIQKKQMTTQKGANVHIIGISGNFDDAQNAVKALFLNENLKTDLLKKGYQFSSANSINIGRLIPQIVYYFNAYLELVKKGVLHLGEPVNIAVPTGNFGNILAAYYAQQMGLPVKQFICASNVNYVLTDFIQTGLYDINRPFEVTNSPSMDILISSNLERFLYAISDQDNTLVTELMAQLKENGKYQISAEMAKKMSSFVGGYASGDETVAAIKQLYNKYQYVADTHTAVAYKVYLDYALKNDDQTPTLIASTASPFKFTKSVVEGLGEPTTEIDDFDLIYELSKRSGLSIPLSIKDLKNKAILHPKTIHKSAIKDEVIHILK